MIFEALLWDCDGVLIDSEHIACGLFAEMLTEAGYNITAQEFITRFCGQGKKHIYNSIEEDCGVNYNEYMNTANKKEIQREMFRKELKVIDCINETLDQINLPMAIASGSEMERLEFTLGITNLYERFNGRIYSSSLVTKSKPYPDIFLYAAEKLNTAPEKCLVIEDSLNGVRAGVAAGMTVFGFTGGSHVIDKNAHRLELLTLGADLVFDDMRELPRLMREFKLEQNNTAV